MIASFTNNFIFIKSTKTAGTSVEIVLSTWCSGRDIVTRFNDEPLRTQFGGRPMNDLGLFGLKRYRKHMSAAQVRRKLPDFWNRAFKFSIERHPYELVVSRAFWETAWRIRRNPRTNFQQTLQRVIDRNGFHNRRYYEIAGKIVADEIIPYDNLWPRLAELASQWGRELPARLPRAKGRHRRDRRPAHEILSEVQKGKIRKLAAWEFEHFGFEP